MSYGSETAASASAEYSGQVYLDTDPGSQETITFRYVNNYPMGGLTEAERDAVFQDFIDYVAAYSHVTSVLASKIYTSLREVTPA